VLVFTSLATLVTPLTTVVATPVATEAAPEVTTETMLAAPLVTSDIMDSICAVATEAATRGRRMVEKRIV